MPVKIELADTVLALAAGYFYNCAATADGRTYCWGANDYGQLGVEDSIERCSGGEYQCSGTPQDSGLEVRPDALTAAFIGPCALQGESPICWGYSPGDPFSNGQWGQPFPPTVLPVSVGIEKLAANSGSYEFCGLRVDNHELVCWNRSVLRGETTALDLDFAHGAVGIAFASVVLGQLHACGIDLSGTALCWGSNWFGQLGAGSAGGDGGLANAASPIAVTGGLQFEQLVTGGSYTCGLIASGEVYCWGDPAIAGGALAQTYVSRPTAIAGNYRFESIYAGFGHVCALNAESRAFCWGANAFGALGDGTVVDSFTPVPVAGGLQFATLALGGIHSCGITRDAQLYCWGGNNYGQIARAPSDR